jgi:hypothetical protein
MQIKTRLRFHLTLLEWLSSRTPPITNAGKGVRKKEPSYTANGNASKYNHFGKQYGGSLKN